MTATSHLKIYDAARVRELTRHREGEVKIGERVVAGDQGFDNDCRFVIVGIPEDIGVRANHGRAGAATAFRPALDSFLNEQDNFFFDSSSVMVLGEVMVDDLMAMASALDQKEPEDLSELRKLVGHVDERVTGVIREIVRHGKTPIVIGGGHNNAYGNIRGTSEALQSKIHVVNCDPHLDFRAAEGRHSGNPFSCAFDEGYMDKYAVTAMHEQYNNRSAVERFMHAPRSLFFNTYESVFVRNEIDFSKAVQQCIHFVGSGPCGIEIDLDAITNVPSSARTSSGISPVQARQYIHACASQLDAKYLHIAEGAPVLAHIKADNKTGKLIAYLVTDFIKAMK